MAKTKRAEVMTVEMATELIKKGSARRYGGEVTISNVKGFDYEVVYPHIDKVAHFTTAQLLEHGDKMFNEE